MKDGCYRSDENECSVLNEWNEMGVWYRMEWKYEWMMWSDEHDGGRIRMNGV